MLPASRGLGSVKGRIPSFSTLPGTTSPKRIPSVRFTGFLGSMQAWSAIDHGIDAPDLAPVRLEHVESNFQRRSVVVFGTCAFGREPLHRRLRSDDGGP